MSDSFNNKCEQSLKKLFLCKSAKTFAKIIGLDRGGGRIKNTSILSGLFSETRSRSAGATQMAARTARGESEYCATSRKVLEPDIAGHQADRAHIGHKFECQNLKINHFIKYII